MDPTLAVALLALAGSVVTAAMTYRASTRATDVNERAAQLQWVKELRSDASDAKQEATDARHQVRELTVEIGGLRRQLDVVTREAEQLVAEMQLCRRTAWRDGMTIDRFREFIGPPPAPATNGHNL